MRSLQLAAGAPLALALLAPLVLAQHGHGDMAMGMPGMEQPQHDAAPAPPPEPPLPSYWKHPEHATLLYVHIAISLLAWVLLLPVAVMMSVARSKLKVPAQVVFLAANGVGLFFGLLYNTQTPDLYPNNAHHQLGWVITWFATAWALMGLLTLYTDRQSASAPETLQRPLLSTHNVAQYGRIQSQEPSQRWSADSNQNTLYQNSRSNSWNSTPDEPFPGEGKPFADDDDEDEDHVVQPAVGAVPGASPLGNSRLDRFLSQNVQRYASGLPLRIFNFIYVLFERTLLVLGFVAISTGAVTWGRTGYGHGVFSTLAHFIKGGIFFVYGLLTFGRWMGCFADFGWAWNIKPGPEVVGPRKAWVPSAEFVESSVIALYGASNVFLEHLGNAGGEWSSVDLEHLAITFLFFGGGCLGMLVESSVARHLLNWTANPHDQKDSSYKAPGSYVHSMNPMPGLVIMLLGIMMSSHTQHSMVAGMMHKLWGTLFTGFAMARGVTYIMLWLKPPQSYLPTRPPTELITAFCLSCGGLIFMASNEDTVAALEEYNLDAMFIFTVTTGFTGLLMTWTMLTILLKNWVSKRIVRRQAYHAPEASPA